MPGTLLRCRMCSTHDRRCRTRDFPCAATTHKVGIESGVQTGRESPRPRPQRGYRHRLLAYSAGLVGTRVNYPASVKTRELRRQLYANNLNPQMETYNQAVMMPGMAVRIAVARFSLCRSSTAEANQTLTKRAENAIRTTNTSSVLRPSIGLTPRRIVEIMPR